MQVNIQGSIDVGACLDSSGYHQRAPQPGSNCWGLNRYFLDTHGHKKSVLVSSMGNLLELTLNVTFLTRWWLICCHLGYGKPESETAAPACRRMRRGAKT